MPFINPVLFWAGTAAVSVPIIIHLLNRRRYKILDWAAMRFLLEAARKNRRRIRIEEMILLFLRCLAVFLLGLAVARFMGCSAVNTVPITAPAQMTHIFILDNSVSMGQKLADTTSFGKAASDLAGMLEKIPSTDRVAVLLTSRPDPSKAVFGLNFLTDPKNLSARIKSLKPSDTDTNLPSALSAAREMFKETGTAKRLYLLSDFRRCDYLPGGNVEQVRKQLKELRQDGVELVMMNYATGAKGNLTAVAVEMIDKLAVASVPIRFQLRVRNDGPERAENVSVRLAVYGADGEKVSLPVRTIRSIDPGQEKRMQFSYVFSTVGPAVIEAKLPADNLMGDNTTYLAIDVRKSRRVLIVDGEPDVVNPVESESFYLVHALDPTGDERYGNKAEVVLLDRLPDVDFDRYEVVILANVPNFPLSLATAGIGEYPVLKALSRYVRNGGGLAIFTGDRVDLSFYNGPFYDQGIGLCPARIAPPVDLTREKKTFVRLKRDSIAPEWVMRSFQGKRGLFTEMIRFYGFTPVEQTGMSVASAEIGPVRILARFDSTRRVGSVPDSPAILARAFGRGEVMMICTSADKQWTDWPKDITYVPFINDVVQFLSRRSDSGLTGMVGQPIYYTLGSEFSSATVTLKTPVFPLRDVITLEAQRLQARRVVSYRDTIFKGVYELSLSQAQEVRKVFFSRNVNPVEGRLARVSRKELAGRLGVKFEYRDRLKPQAEQVTAASEREYWKLALAAMLLVLAAEVFLGQRFGHYQ